MSPTLALLATPSQSQFSPLLGVGSRSDGGGPTEPLARSLKEGGRHRHSIPRGRRRRHRGRDSGRRLRAKLVSPPPLPPCLLRVCHAFTSRCAERKARRAMPPSRSEGASSGDNECLFRRNARLFPSCQRVTFVALHRADRNSMMGLLDIYSELILYISPFAGDPKRRQ